MPVKCAALTATLLATLVAPAAGQTAGDALAPGALDVTMSEVRPLELPPAESLAAIAAAAATDQKLLQRCALYGAKNGDGTGVTIARVPVTDEDGFAVIALTADMAFVAAAIIDHDDGAIAEWQHFTEDLQFHDVPRLEGALPRSHLTELRQRARASEDDADARLTLALLDVLQHMHEQAAAFNLPRDADRDREAEWRAASREYRALAELAGRLEPLLGEATGEFGSLAASSAEAAENLADATRDRDRDAMRTHKRVLTGNCKTCHELPLAHGQMLGELSTTTRHRLGIGDGFYQIGHDLRIRHPDRVRAQHVADALRIGALLIDARRSAK